MQGNLKSLRLTTYARTRRIGTVRLAGDDLEYCGTGEALRWSSKRKEGLAIGKRREGLHCAVGWRQLAKSNNGGLRGQFARAQLGPPPAMDSPVGGTSGRSIPLAPRKAIQREAQRNCTTEGRRLRSPRLETVHLVISEFSGSR